MEGWFKKILQRYTILGKIHNYLFIILLSIDLIRRKGLEKVTIDELVDELIIRGKR